MIPQLEHVRIILSQNGDCVTLLPNHQPSLLLIGIAKVDTVELETKRVFLKQADNE